MAPDILMSNESECLTAVEGTCDREAIGIAAQAFVRAVGRFVPSLAGPSGIFTPYGRVYVDGQHIELALREMASPYELALVFEQMGQVAARATAALNETGTRLILSNNVHGGLLTASNRATFGSHENYLVHRPPKTFGHEILAFLATRIVFAGCGAVEHTTGDFLAGVRVNFMTLDVGGDTTFERALHSLARNEHHTGANPTCFRYHLLSGDGHRSQLNWALHYGSMALALRAIDFDRKLLSRLPPLPAHGENPWVKITRRYNRLARPGELPRVDPLVVAVQRVFLEGARRYADSLIDAADWIGRLLDEDWPTTLLALERNDQDWLSARLDPWIKHRLFSEALKQLGKRWRDVPGNKDLCSELALIDHSYHEFANRNSAFDQLDAAGALDHRVGQAAAPGSESEPYVPDTITRARPRARFIKEHRGSTTIVVDWSVVHDLETGAYRRIDDPFATEFGPWQGQATTVDETAYWRFRRMASELSRIARPPARDVEERLARVFAVYEAGRYDDAHLALDDLEALGVDRSSTGYQKYLRYRAFVETRRGMLTGTTYLDRLRSRDGLDIALATDYMFVARFSGLAPRHDLAVWAARGLAMLPSDPAAPFPPALSEHHACCLVVEGRIEAARDVLEGVRTGASWTGNLRILGRVLAMLGDVYRQLGEPSRAAAALDEAEELQVANGYEGDLAEFTWLGRAKLTNQRRRVRSLLHQARCVQIRTGNRIGLARTLLLEARLLPPRYRLTAERRRRQVRGLVCSVPALCDCRLANKIDQRWQEWVGGARPSGERDPFWGL